MSTTNASTTTSSTTPTTSSTTPGTAPSASTTTTTNPPSAATTTPSTAPSASTTANPPTTNTTNTTNPPAPSILRTSLPHAQARLAAISAEIAYFKTEFETTDSMRAQLVQIVERKLEEAVEEIGEVMMERMFRAKVVEDMRRVFEETRVGWAVRSIREG